MADDNLNPGQQHYEDTYGQYGRIRDIEKQAASGYEHDYSSPTDHSAGVSHNPIQDHNNINSVNDNFLNNAERDMADQSPISSRDLSLGQQERSASHQTSGFSNSQLPISGRQKARLSGFKKKVIIAGVTVFATGGLFLGLFTAISGPLQLVQAAKLIQDFQLGVTAGQKAARALSNTKSIAKNAMSGGGLSERVQNSRLGIFGQKQADNMISRLAERGVEINSNSFGGRGGMTVNPSIAFGIDDLQKGDLDQIARDMGISRDKLEIVNVDARGNQLDIPHLSISDDLSYSDARKVITSLDDPAMTGVKSWMQTRSTLKKTGYVSWLHPLEKAKSSMYKSLTDFIDDQIGKIMNPDNSLSRIKEGLREDPVPDDVDSGPDIDTDTNFRNTEESLGETIKKKGRAVLSKAQTAWNAIDNFMSLRSVNIIQTVIGVICMMQSIHREAGAYKQTNIVNVAEKGSSQIMGYGSQVQSGEDIDLESAGMAVKMTMGDDIEQLDSSGQSTGETKFSSFWDAYPICTTLGTADCGESQEANVPQTLGTVADGARFFSNEAIDGIINVVLGTPVVGFICWAFNFLNLFDIIGNIIGEAISGVISSLGVFNNFMNDLAGYFLGTPLDLATMTPEQWGSVGMYGGVFTSNDQARESGGKKLTNQQAIELNLENRRYLAWENSKKPILARLFDPADYNSSVNQLARAIRIDSSEQTLSTQLANVFKVFTSAPTILATAGNQLLGGSAYAASTYDYGVPIYGWDLTEMDEITNSSNNQYDLYTNTRNALDILQREDELAEQLADQGYPVDTEEEEWQHTPKHAYAKYCLSSDIQNEDSDYKINPVDNQDGNGWNYVDDDSLCASYSSDASMKPIRLYVMDYYNVVSGMCYYGDESDSDSNSACDEMSVNSAGGSSSAGASSFSEDIETMLKQFESDTGGSGDWDGAYGRQCVDMSVWFLDNFTTLNHASNNGNQFVNSLVAANPQLSITSTPEAPAFFSVNCYDTPAMTSNCPYGHTGVVLQVDADGTIHTLENSGSLGTSYTRTWTPSQYTGALFVNVGDYLK